IIALSEEYHIITPYTSLLLLESDEDRERFGVKRRYEMRDGERFFAEGRANADFELLQKQMKQAGDWRVGLRRLILRQLAAMGRDPRLLQPPDGGFVTLATMPISSISEVGAVPDQSGGGGGVGGGFGGGGFGNYDDRQNFDRLSASFLGDRDFAEDAEVYARGEQRQQSWGRSDMAESVEDFSGFAFDPVPAESMSLTPGRNGDWLSNEFEEFAQRVRPEIAGGSFGPRPGLLPAIGPVPSGYYRGNRSVLSTRVYPVGGLVGGFALNRKRLEWHDYTQWVTTLFPHLPDPPTPRPEVQSDWPQEAIELSKSLLRTDELRQMQGGIEIRRTSQSFNPLRAQLTSHSEQLELYSPTAWLTRPLGAGGHTIINWADEKERGVFSRAFQLGRLRNSAPVDLAQPPLGLDDHSLRSLSETHTGYTARVEPQGEDRALLVLTYPHNHVRLGIRMLIDTRRHVVLKIEHVNAGKVRFAKTFSDFVDVAGSWWPTKIATTDAEGRQTRMVTQRITAHPQDDFTERMREELLPRETVQFLRLPLPSVSDAKQAVAAENATFQHRFVLLLHFELSQQ
ncbi:MAG: hypothetical protein ACREIV_06400, partial [Planctomycetaceae bacterium]